jgi:hypothetical protein
MKELEPLSAQDMQRLTEKLQSLSPGDRRTVEDFVDFLCSRAADQRLSSGTTAHASESALAAVWNTPGRCRVRSVVIVPEPTGKS